MKHQKTILLPTQLADLIFCCPDFFKEAGEGSRPVTVPYMRYAYTLAQIEEVSMLEIQRTRKNKQNNQRTEPRADAEQTAKCGVHQFRRRRRRRVESAHVTKPRSAIIEGAPRPRRGRKEEGRRVKNKLTLY